MVILIDGRVIIWIFVLSINPWPSYKVLSITFHSTLIHWRKRTFAVFVAHFKHSWPVEKFYCSAGLQEIGRERRLRVYWPFLGIMQGLNIGLRRTEPWRRSKKVTFESCGHEAKKSSSTLPNAAVLNSGCCWLQLGPSTDLYCRLCGIIFWFVLSWSEDTYYCGQNLNAANEQTNSEL